MIRPLLIVLSLAAGPAMAQAGPNPQLAASIQARLDLLGFREVDADRLTLNQAAALHFELHRRSLFRLAGPDRLRLQQKVEAILRRDTSWRD